MENRFFWQLALFFYKSPFVSVPTREFFTHTKQRLCKKKKISIRKFVKIKSQTNSVRNQFKSRLLS